MKTSTVEEKKRLLELVQSFPILYDHHHKDFYNRAKKESKWKTIGKKMHIKRKECKKRWYAIRYHYTRSIKLGNIYYLSKYLGFLNPYMQLVKRKEPEFEPSIKEFTESLCDNFSDFFVLSRVNKKKVLNDVLALLK